MRKSSRAWLKAILCAPLVRLTNSSKVAVFKLVEDAGKERAQRASEESEDGSGIFRTRSFRHRFAIHSPELNCHNKTFHVKHFAEFPASQMRFSDHHPQFDSNFVRRLRHRSTPCYRKHRARFVRASADAAFGEDVSRETFPPDQRANTCLFRRSTRDIAATMQVIPSQSTTTNCYRQSENVSRETFPPKSATEQRQNLESRAESAR